MRGQEGFGGLPHLGRTATIESFNGKLRDELLNVEVSSMLKEAQMPTGGGSTTACIRAAH